MPEATAHEAASPLHGGGKHIFTVSVRMRGHGHQSTVDLIPQTVHAYSLHEALAIAAETPLDNWFSEDETEKNDA